MVVKAREASRHHRAAVIAAPPRDDFFLAWPPEHIVVVPDDLQLRFVRIRSRHAELDALHASWRYFQQACAEANGRFIRITAKRRIVRQLQGLLVHRIGDLTPAIANEVAIDSGKGI